MPQQVHTFALTASFGAPQIFQILRRVCEHPGQRDFQPDFEFDWIARRIALSAASREGLEACHQVLLQQAAKAGAEEGALLAGAVVERPDGRFERPYGVAVHDPATFGELIGRSLVEVGLRGIQVVDSAGVCRINVRLNASSKAMDYQSLIREFPLPGYITLKDEGVHVQQDVARRPARPGRKGRRR